MAEVGRGDYQTDESPAERVVYAAEIKNVLQWSLKIRPGAGMIHQGYTTLSGFLPLKISQQRRKSIFQKSFGMIE